jgi:hypothetical protein
MSAYRSLIDTQQLLLRWPGLQLLVESPHKGPLFLRVGLQVPLAQATHAKSQGMQPLAHPFPAILDPKAGVDEVPYQFRGPEAHVVACLARTVANGFLHLRQLFLAESRRASRNGRPFQTGKATSVKCMHPAPHRLFFPIQPLGNFRARLTIHQEHNAVVPLAQPDIMRPPKGGPHRLTSDSSVRDSQHRQALLLHGVLSSVIPSGPETGFLFLDYCSSLRLAETEIGGLSRRHTQGCRGLRSAAIWHQRRHTVKGLTALKHSAQKSSISPAKGFLVGSLQQPCLLLTCEERGDFPVRYRKPLWLSSHKPRNMDGKRGGKKPIRCPLPTLGHSRSTSLLCKPLPRVVDQHFSL